MNETKYIVPKSLDANNILDFLRMTEDVFKMKGQLIPNVMFDLSNVNRTNILGLLLIYKFVEYTSINDCFKNPLLQYNNYVEEELKKYGFWELLQAYMNEKDFNYRDLDFKDEGRFFIAPLALLREKKYNIEESFLPKIENYYAYDEKVVSMVLTCLGEVLLNFWEHAVNDTKSIIVAVGNKDKVEIACADTGNGSVSTLAPVLNYKGPKENILGKALIKGITSKKMTNHMGYGLWILDEIVTATQGKLHIYSEGAYIFNNHGKKIKGLCSFWQGTIIYLSLPLANPKTLSDIASVYDDDSLTEIKIKFE